MTSVAQEPIGIDSASIYRAIVEKLLAESATRRLGERTFSYLPNAKWEIADLYLLDTMETLLSVEKGIIDQMAKIEHQTVADSRRTPSNKGLAAWLQSVYERVNKELALCFKEVTVTTSHMLIGSCTPRSSPSPISAGSGGVSK